MAQRHGGALRLAELGWPIMLSGLVLIFGTGRKLVANIDQREGILLHLRLIDPSDPNARTIPLACLNADLVREGLATVDKSPAIHQLVPPDHEET